MANHATFKDVRTDTVVAAGTIVADRFISYAGAQTGLNADAVLGVSTQAQTAGLAVCVITQGSAKVQMAAPITAGALVGTNATGQGTAAGTRADALGRAKFACGANEVTEVDLSLPRT